MWVKVYDTKDLKEEYVDLLYKEAAKTRTELSDQMLHSKIIQKYMDTFKNGRKDSKAWTEAADFLETYFDENNRVMIETWFICIEIKQYIKILKQGKNGNK